MDNYQSISCAQYSEYELLAMHRTPVEVSLRDSEQRHHGRILDLITRQGAEYMLLREENGGEVEIRLDQIAAVEKRG